MTTEETVTHMACTRLDCSLFQWGQIGLETDVHYTIKRLSVAKCGREVGSWITTDKAYAVSSENICFCLTKAGERNHWLWIKLSAK